MAKAPATFHVGRVRVRVRRGPREGGVWYWRADRADGKGGREDVWTGWATRDEAEARVMDILREADPVAPSGGEIRTIHDLLDCWLAAQKARGDIGEATKKHSDGAVQRLIDGEIRHVHVARLDRGALERHRDAELRRGAGTATIRRDLKTLRQAWRWGREIGQVPLRDLPVVKVHRDRPVYTRYTPTREEVAKILGTLRPWVRVAVVLLSSTGARVGEVAGLTWGRVAPDCSRVWFVGKTNLDHEPREVPLHPAVARELLAWREECCDTGAEDTVTGTTPATGVVHIQRSLRNASDKLKLGGRVSPNGLRRAVTDALYHAGVGVDVEAALLGHSPQTAMQHYRRVAEEDQRAALLVAGLGVAGQTEVVDLEEERERRRR